MSDTPEFEKNKQNDQTKAFNKRDAEFTGFPEQDITTDDAQYLKSVVHNVQHKEVKKLLKMGKKQFISFLEKHPYAGEYLIHLVNQHRHLTKYKIRTILDSAHLDNDQYIHPMQKEEYYLLQGILLGMLRQVNLTKRSIARLLDHPALTEDTILQMIEHNGISRHVIHAVAKTQRWAKREVYEALSRDLEMDGTLFKLLRDSSFFSPSMVRNILSNEHLKVEILDMLAKIPTLTKDEYLAILDHTQSPSYVRDRAEKAYEALTKREGNIAKASKKINVE